MRRKNKFPPPSQPDQAAPASLTDKEADRVKTEQSIVVMERILTQALDPNFGVTPEQLGDLCQMFLGDMFLRKVHPEFWMVHAEIVFELIGLCSGIEAENRLLKTEGVPDKVKETMKAAMELSLREINGLRKNLIKSLDLLKQCPMPGTIVH